MGMMRMLDTREERRACAKRYWAQFKARVKSFPQSRWIFLLYLTAAGLLLIAGFIAFIKAHSFKQWAFFFCAYVIEDILFAAVLGGWFVAWYSWCATAALFLGRDIDAESKYEMPFSRNMPGVVFFWIIFFLVIYFLAGHIPVVGKYVEHSFLFEGNDDGDGYDAYDHYG